MKRRRESEEISHDTDEEGQNHDEAQPSLPKVTELDVLDDDTSVEMKCSLPPHKTVTIFRTYQEYETHYAMAHSNRCVQCHKNFPSSWFLDLHIEERHDSIIEVKRERGEHTVSPSNLGSNFSICFPI
jgi:hypothetical protein